MSLFDKIPENFFSILVSKNKKIYVDALFVLGEAYNQEMALPKDNIVSRLINNLENEFIEEDFSEEDEENEIKDNNVSSKAYFLLRKLKWAGWIEFEMQRNSFEEFIIIPDYSIKFINLLMSIEEEQQVEFNSYVFATYSGLKQASKDKSETYNAINLAYTNTLQLVNELKSLYNSLGRFHRKLSNETNANEIIKEHFFSYKEYSDNVIFPRFTRDSVPRYKNLIKNMLNDILSDANLINMTSEIVTKSGRYKNEQDAKDDILNKLRVILEIYENIDFTMDQIEIKNTDYIRATVQRMDYLLTSDKELKGKIVSILKQSKSNKVQELMSEKANLVRQEYISQDSAYIRNISEDARLKNPMKIKEDKPMDYKSLEGLVKNFERLYSNKQINEFMERNFKDKPFIMSSEIQLNTTEDLILLILATIKADNNEKSFYYTQDNNEEINNNGYIIPNMKFIRRR